MFGLVILLILGLWLLLTIFFMREGWKAGNKIESKILNMFVGFMLPMGCFVIYWIIEYSTLQNKVSELYREQGGSFFYIKPEEYKRMIGVTEWNNLPLIYEEIPKNKQEGKVFFNKLFVPFIQWNRRVRSYISIKNINGIKEKDIVYYDLLEDKVLFRVVTYKVGVPPLSQSLSGLKIWLDVIEDCSLGSDRSRHIGNEYTNTNIGVNYE